MSSVARFYDTCDVKRPSSAGFRLGLNSLIHWFTGAAHEPADACQLDGLNDHYLRDAGIESGPSSGISEQTMCHLRIGPRAP